MSWTNWSAYCSLDQFIVIAENLFIIKKAQRSIKLVGFSLDLCNLWRKHPYDAIAMNV